MYTQMAIQASKMTSEFVWKCSGQNTMYTSGLCGIQDNGNADALATGQSTHTTVLSQQFQSHHTLRGPELA